MLNTNISFQEAQENGYAIVKNTKIDGITIYSPFHRKLITLTALNEEMIEVKFARGDLLYASKVDVNFFVSMDTCETKMMRIDMQIPEYKNCTGIITENEEYIDVNVYWN